MNIGAARFDRVKKGARFGLAFACGCAAAIGVIFFAFASFFIGLFGKSPEALAAGVLRARICTLFYAMLAFSHGVAAVCRGAGYSKVPMFIMLGTWCIFRVAYIETVVHLHGSIALVFWAYPITWCMSSVLFLLYYSKSRWLERIQEKAAVKNQ